MKELKLGELYYEISRHNPPALTIQPGETVSVEITVASINDAPVGGEDNYSVGEDQTLTVDTAAGLLVNDSDAEGDALQRAVQYVGNKNGRSDVRRVARDARVQCRRVVHLHAGRRLPER